MKPLFLILLAITLAVAASAQPLQSIWDRSGLQDSSEYGGAILPLGDQNGDGFADWAVLAFGNGDFTGSEKGYLEFFHGGNPPLTTPYFTLRGDNVTWQMGDARVLGDVNGDGYVDWYYQEIGLPDYQWWNAVVCFGGPSVDTTHVLRFVLPMRGGFGPLGDYNGDGYADVARYDDRGDSLAVYWGSAQPDTIADWILHESINTDQEAAPAALGDLNGDGFGDWVSYSPSGTGLFPTYVFLGSAHPDTVPAYTWPNLPDIPRGVVRDLNGDGYAEIIYDTFPLGSSGVCYGGPTLNPIPDATLHYPCDSGINVVVSAGDINHDGYNDLILLRDYCDNQSFGFCSLYLGHPWLNPEPAFTISGWSDPLNLIGICTAAGVGDVNGDSIDDIAIGATTSDAWQGNRGRCVILAGDSSIRAGAHETPTGIPQRLEVSVYPNPFNAQTTVALEVPWGVATVTLTTYNVLGQQVAHSTLRAMPGPMRYGYDALNLPSGVYLLRVRAGSFATTQKLMLLK